MTFITFLRACLSPPGLQILLVLLGLWALRRRRLAWGRSLIGLALVSLWLMATPQGAAWLLQGLERYPAITEPARLRAEGWQAIVVIGGLVSSTLLTLVLLPILYRRFSAPQPQLAS